MRQPLVSGIPDDLAAAKRELRERLAPTVVRLVPEAIALRQVNRFRPTPGVNLVGIGIGEKVVSGARTGEACVKVLVAKKFPAGKIRPADRIPASVGGMPTDIEAVGYPRKFVIPQRRRHRPVPGGVSVGLDFNAVPVRFAGTLGVVLEDREDNKTHYALSNNHVLADENRAAIGAGVVQPATLDGARNTDRVARLSRFVRLRFGNRSNLMDAAIAEFMPGVRAAAMILGIGPPTGAADPSLHLLVRKSGRTTGITEGIVRVVDFDVFNVQYDQGMVRVDNVIVIEGVASAFSAPGDSGSAIVDSHGRVVALLFAGSDQVTFAIPIRRVLRRFRVQIAR